MCVEKITSNRPKHVAHVVQSFGTKLWFKRLPSIYSALSLSLFVRGKIFSSALAKRRHSDVTPESAVGRVDCKSQNGNCKSLVLPVFFCCHRHNLYVCVHVWTSVCVCVCGAFSSLLSCSPRFRKELRFVLSAIQMLHAQLLIWRHFNYTCRAHLTHDRIKLNQQLDFFTLIFFCRLAALWVKFSSFRMFPFIMSHSVCSFYRFSIRK